MDASRSTSLACRPPCALHLFPFGFFIWPVALPNFRELDPTIPNASHGLHPDPRQCRRKAAHGALTSPASCCPCRAVTAPSRDSPFQQTLGLDAGVIIARDLDTPNGRLLQGAWLPNDGGLVRWSTGPASCLPPAPSVRANSTRRLSPSTAVRNAASACGSTETGRSWAGLGWTGLGALETRNREARAPSKLSIGLALFDPDHRAVSCTPSRARPRTGSEGLDAARPVASTNRSILSDQRATALPVYAAPPPPLKYMSCAALCAAKGLMLAHLAAHAARTVAFSSRPAACDDEIAVSCRFPLSFVLHTLKLQPCPIQRSHPAPDDPPELNRFKSQHAHTRPRRATLFFC